MGGEARGQVGGMEAGEGLRRKLAGESRGWVCQGCGGRRNDEWVVGEEAVGEGEAERVPEELRLGYRDEMTSGESPSKTTPVPPETQTPATSPPPTSTSTQTPTPPPTTTISPPPPWLDSAIYAIAFLLALMIARKVYLLEIDEY
jgi:ubiquitin-conjugating enzyme E2 J1